MKNFTFLLIFLFLPVFIQLQAQTSSRVKISLDQKTISILTDHGIPIDEGIDKSGKYLETDLYDKEINAIVSEGAVCEVIIPDVATFYKNRYLESVNSSEFKDLLKIQELIYQVPGNFHLGSMGGFCTWDQILDQLDSMALLYPNLVKVKQPISSTYSIENRPIYWLKISDNPNIDETEPEILYTGLHHAREPIGVQQMLFYMWYLLENYDTDSTIQYILNNAELYFVPVVNPDGYCYNEQTNPFGGGNWRKNRRNTGSAYGIDLNRNYGYMWGIDDIGSSPDPNEETYRGSAAFSEPEMQNIQEFCNSRQFKLCLNYHSFANKLLYAWGYDDVNAATADDSIFSAYARILTRENHFFYGPGATAIYITNGGSDDWMYGEQITKSKIFAYTAEVGTASDGFWPEPENIIPICQNNMWQNLNAALLCLKYAIVEDKTPFNLNDNFGYIKYDIKNLGIESPADFTLSIEPLSNNITIIDGPVNYVNLQYMETRYDSVYYQLVQGIQPGDEVIYVLKLSNGMSIYSDTITKKFGSVTNLVYDSCNNINNWTGTWAITHSSFHSPSGSITDSPYGNYSGFTNSSITTSQPIILPSGSQLFISYWAKWDIEPDFDYVQFKISTNDGINWTALDGLHTQEGTFSQVFMEPVYDGIQSEWVEELIDISAYAGVSVKLRFTLMTDEYLACDGFYFDDFRLISLSPGTGISNINTCISSSEPVPNPAGNVCKIFFDSRENGYAEFEVSDASGRIVYKNKVSLQSGNIELSLKGWKSGVYLYSFVKDEVRSEVRKLIVIPD